MRCLIMKHTNLFFCKSELFIILLRYDRCVAEIIKFDVSGILLQYIQVCDLCIPVNKDDGEFYLWTHLLGKLILKNRSEWKEEF